MRPKGIEKVPLNLHVDQETKERLRLYANQRRTNISQAVTDWIWTQPVDGSAKAGANDDN